MFHFLSIILGIMISMMLTINSQFALMLGNFQSTLIIHLVGLGIMIPVVLLSGEKKRGPKVPSYLYTAGMIGVLLIFLNNRCFNNIGASLTVSLVILGQTLAGQVIDATGFLGMKKHPFRISKVPGWILILSGAAVMTGGSTGNAFYLLLAFISGALVMISAVFNARLAASIGLMRGTALNYVVGLLTVILILLMMGSTPGEYKGLLSIHPLFVFGGGALGVVIVSGLSAVIPRIPAVYSTILVFIGQVGAGLIFDLLYLDRFSLYKAAGAVVITAGLLLIILGDLNDQKKAAALVNSTD